MSKRRRITLERVPRKRLEAAIAVHESIMTRHPRSSETYKYGAESVAKMRGELARRDRIRKQNRREVPAMAKRGKRRRISGCYMVGSARRRRRKANPRKRPVPCYAIGKARIRRRKMNRAPTRTATRPLYCLYAKRTGRRPLKYVGNNKFSTKGRAVLFRGRAEAHAVAWVLKNSFPDALRGYTLKPEPHP